jgi:hypothetical protein
VEVNNALAYYCTEKITTVKSFIGGAEGREDDIDGWTDEWGDSLPPEEYSKLWLKVHLHVRFWHCKICAAFLLCKCSLFQCNDEFMELRQVQ